MENKNETEEITTLQLTAITTAVLIICTLSVFGMFAVWDIVKHIIDKQTNLNQEQSQDLEISYLKEELNQMQSKFECLRYSGKLKVTSVYVAADGTGFATYHCLKNDEEYYWNGHNESWQTEDTKVYGKTLK